jgi:PAS domain S-box-containing protein
MKVPVPTSSPVNHDSPPASVPTRRARTGGVSLRRGLVASLIILTLGASIGLIHRNYLADHLVTAQQELAAVANLQAADLSRYRLEREADAAAYFQGEAFGRLVRGVLAEPASSRARRELQTALKQFSNHYQHDQAVLLDVRGEVLGQASATAAQLSTNLAPAMAEARATGEVVFQDFHRNEHDGRVYLALLLPVTEGPDNPRPAGIVALRINPETYIYPFLRRWPTQFKSAETMLVRRDGSEVVLLSPLRSRPGVRPLDFRLPLTRTDVPAAQAVQGVQGATTGHDLRGEPVLGAVQPVPDTPWFLVVQMERAEVTAPLERNFWALTATVIALLVVTTGLVWGSQQARRARRQFQRERQMHAQMRLLAETQIAVLNALPAHIALLDREGNIEAVNESWRRFATANGLPGAQCGEGQNYLKVCDQTQGEGADEARAAAIGLRRVLAGEAREFALEYACHAPTEPRWFRLMATPLGDGPHTRAVVMHLDITERRLAEFSIRESEARFRSLFEQSAVGMSLATADGRILRLNDRFGEILGYPPEELLGRDPADFTHPEDQAKGREMRARLLSGELKTCTWEKRYRRQNGSVVWCILTLSLLPAVEGQPPQFVGVINDITERKQAEEALRASREAYAELVERVPVGVYQMTGATGSREDRFSYVSPRLCEMTGITHEEFMQKASRMFEAVHPDDLADMLRRRKLTHAELTPFEWEGRMLVHGRTRWIRIESNAHRLEDGTFTIHGIVQDITAQKDAEAAQQKLIQELEATLAKVQTLSGLLPICSGCKKIRDDRGYWNQVEQYLQRHTRATFTHGLCPDCTKHYFPDLAHLVNPSTAVQRPTL